MGVSAFCLQVCKQLAMSNTTALAVVRDPILPVLFMSAYWKQILVLLLAIEHPLNLLLLLQLDMPNLNREVQRHA